MDDFEKAILFSFDQTGSIDANLRAQATAFCEQVKQSPTVVQLCLEKLRFSGYVEVQFWSLQTLEELLKQSYGALNSQLVRSSLMAAVSNYDVVVDTTNHQVTPPFIRNKLAKVIVLLICIEYPTKWPTVFSELVALLPKGPYPVDMFCRILVTLDEEVISLDYPRTPADQSLATRIKDSMRQQCITQVAAAWYNLAVLYRSGARAELAVNVFETMRRYIPWMDIGLVVNESFIPLMFEILVSSRDSLQLRGAVADCLLAVVLKRMDASAKLSLLQQLQLGEVCAQVMSMQDVQFANKLSGLLTGLAAEVLECSKKLETNGVANGGVAEMVPAMLDKILPSVFYFMQHDDEDISATTFQFLSNYVNKMKPASVRVDHLSHILELVRFRMRYSADDKEALDVLDKSGEEEEARMSEYRRDLVALFRNVYRVAPDVTTSFVKNVLAPILGNSCAPFEEVEVGITLLYYLGEGLSEDTLKAESGDIWEILGALLTMTVPCTSHRLVAVVFLETVIRYVKFIQYHEVYIPPVLGAFLDSRGIRHPNPHVSARASYLFMKLVKALRLQLLPFVDNILQSLQDTLCVSLKKLPAKESSSEDRNYTFEAVGLLIGAEELPREKQESFLSAVLVPIFSQVDTLLANKTTYTDGVTVPLLQQIVLAITHFSKGFGEQMLVNSRPELGNVFKQSVEVVMKILLSYPRVELLRTKVISFLHRMVDILGSSVFPFLPTAIQQLLLQSEPKDLVEFIQLLNQLMYKFKAAMGTIMQEIFPSVVDRVSILLPKGSTLEDSLANTEETRELQELQKVFLVFINAIALNDLSSVLLVQSSARLHETIQLLLECSCSHKDVLVRKICVQALARLALDWCGDATAVEMVPGFYAFVIDRFATDCCVRSILQASFNLNDANTVALLGEIAAAQKTLYEKCGEDFLMQMATKVLPAVRCPPNMAEEYCLQIQRSDSKGLKTFYRSFAEKLRCHQ